MTGKTRKTFVAVLLLFSAMGVMLSLLGTARAAELDDKSEKIIAEMDEVKRENRLLQAKCETIMSLEELESYALDELGMQHICRWQIISLEAEK